MKNLDIKISAFIIVAYLFLSWVPTGIDDFFLPGSQPGESGTFDSPNQCDNCHGGYDVAAEPAFAWRGSMMSQAMRDPLYLASLTIANQDALDAGDLCIRCHSPVGWLEGRSTPTDGSLLNDNDKEGVQCHFCHKLIDPESTTPLDIAYMNTITNIPSQHGNGMFVVDSENHAKRGPYNDAEANHPTIHSPFHSKSELCASCHDVSNPAFTLAPDGTYQPNNFDEASPTFNTYEMFPVERTYSEWKMSAYNTAEGIPSEVFGGNKTNVSSCQDCHMNDVSGFGSNKPNTPFRTDLPFHDMTGGNTFIPLLIKQQYPGIVDNDALDAGILRAEGMLQNAATMNLIVAPEGGEYEAYVEIINETGHKLPSGYPEGRRMWINLIAYDINDNILFESGAYDPSTAVLDQNGAKIYEAKLGMSEGVAAAANSNGSTVYNAGESFHFALNNMIVKDNRIPPRGFTNANFESIQAAPVGYNYEDGDYFDTTEYYLPANTYRVVAKLLYQTVSKEYIEFLRDKNITNNTGEVLYSLWEANGKSTPVIMQEAEFFTEPLNVNDEDLIKNDFKIFPNPASDLVNVKFNLVHTTEVKIEVFDLNGKLIETLFNETLITQDQHMVIKTNSLSSGSYIIRFSYLNRSESRILMIK